MRIVSLLILFFYLIQSTNALPMPGPPAGYKISGPYTSGNLSVYMVHGKNMLKGHVVMTLQEALDKQSVVIYETGNVNELKIENLSQYPVFIQAGDIIKGGRQDRTIQYDLILPPKSGKIPLKVFCVEHGRWSQRGSEVAESFRSSENSLAGKELKLAAKLQGEQQRVWDQVSRAQEKLKANVPQAAVSLPACPSPSSLQLTLENEAVNKAAKAQAKDLAKLVEQNRDAIGYVFTVNGQINSADIYASHDLFAKLWPKLLSASTVEALSDIKSSRTNYSNSSKAKVEEFITRRDEGQREERKVGANGVAIIQQDKKSVSFETKDKQFEDCVLHKNIIAK